MNRLLVILLFIGFAGCSENSLEESGNETVVSDTSDVVSETMISETSIITCPRCDFQKEEVLPTEICLIKYNCDSCGKTMYPATGDCCVFCTYGDHKCPSMQE